MQHVIKPFRLALSDDILSELRVRLDDTRWPEAELVDDRSQGAPLEWIQDMCRYWAHRCNWRASEARLNRFAHYTTELDGLDIPFVHVRSPHAEVTPLVITHGWPGSIVDSHKVIEPLTNPTAFRGEATDAFHVVCPSLARFRFFAKPTSTGWGAPKLTGAWGAIDESARLCPIGGTGW